MSANISATVNKFPEAGFEPVALPKVVLSTAASGLGDDVLIIATCEDDFEAKDGSVTVHNSALQSFGDSLNSAIHDVLKFGGFEGKQGQTSQIMRVGAPSGPKYVGLVGLGKTSGLTAAPSTGWGPSAYQKCGGAVTAAAKSHKAVSVTVAFLVEPSAEAVEKLSTGILLASFQSTRFRSKPKDPLKLETVTLLLTSARGEVEAAVERAGVLASGNMITRYLVEGPPNVCTPTHMAEAAQYLAAKYPDTLTLKVLEREDCAALGMGLFLGVTECADEPPKFIHLTYTPPGEVTKKVALVGKGITFDTGGYNLKVNALIELMKFDMAGAAAILGAANIMAGLKLSGTEVHCIIASCENMVDGKGTRPSDVLKSAAGKTVEVNNTDCEGRLVLADAVWYAQTQAGVKTVVDVATLTGAVMVALGLDIAGVVSPSDELAEALLAASRCAGEKLWRLPLEPGYATCLDSSIADLRNHGATRWGGVMVGANFVKEFIQEGTEWAHLDVSGPVWDQGQNLATGYGAALLAAWVESLGTN